MLPTPFTVRRNNRPLRKPEHRARREPSTARVAGSTGRHCKHHYPDDLIDEAERRNLTTQYRSLKVDRENTFNRRTPVSAERRLRAKYHQRHVQESAQLNDLVLFLREFGSATGDYAVIQDGDRLYNR